MQQMSKYYISTQDTTIECLYYGDPFCKLFTFYTLFCISFKKDVISLLNSSSTVIFQVQNTSEFHSILTFHTNFVNIYSSLLFFLHNFHSNLYTLAINNELQLTLSN